MKKTTTILATALISLSVVGCKPINFKGKAPLEESTKVKENIKVKENEAIIDKMIYKDRITKLRTQNANTILELQTLKSCLRMIGLKQDVKMKIKKAKKADAKADVKGYNDAIKSLDKFIKRYNCNSVLEKIIFKTAK